MGLPNPETAPAKIEAREKALQALELRKHGATFAMIAERVGYADESGARKAVQSLLKKREYEAVDEARKLELERLDGMQLAIAPQVRNGNFGAIDRAIRIMERRAKLLGLDAPTKTDINLDVSKLSDDELFAITQDKSGG